MSAQRLLSELDRLGVELRADGDRLRYGGPEEAITPELLGRIKAHKTELLRLLTWDEDEACRLIKDAWVYQPEQHVKAGQPVDQHRAFVREPSEPEEEPDSPIPNHDKSDRSDQSPDYQAVLEVLRDPPYWLKDCYMAAHERGTVTLFVLSAAVAAALGRSPYEWDQRLKPLVERAMRERAEEKRRSG